MKTRIFWTSIFEDSYYDSLRQDEALVFMYYIFNSRVGLSPFYESLDSIAVVACKLGSRNRLEEIKRKFDKDGKILFNGSWVCIVNSLKYNKYIGEKNLKALNNEMERVPEQFLKYCLDRVSMEYQYPIYSLINQNLNIKSETRNQKPEIKKEGNKVFLANLHQKLADKYRGEATVSPSIP